MTTFIDTNILVSILNPKEKLHNWSITKLNECKAQGPAVISDIVYCELSAGMASQNEVDTAIKAFGLQRYASNDAALFRAGAAFKKYKGCKGTKTNVLPDFLIGALAETVGVPLLTANRKDFVSYFPNLQIIAPH
jgi:predicted nucleic acid-binding protein